MPYTACISRGFSRRYTHLPLYALEGPNSGLSSLQSSPLLLPLCIRPLCRAQPGRHLLRETSKAFFAPRRNWRACFQCSHQCLFLSGHLAQSVFIVSTCVFPRDRVTVEGRGSVQLITVCPVPPSDTVLGGGVGEGF